MNKIIDNKIDYLFDLDDVPKQVYNVNLSEQQVKRLASGLKTDLIEGLETEDGVTSGKISLSAAEDGKIHINITEKEETLYIPHEILGNTLTDINKQELLDGALLSLIYKGNQYFVGIDQDLNKITISTDREMGIPQSFCNYTLDETDKYRLANGSVTDQRLFQTNKGDYFLAKLNLTNDKKGIEILEIKTISKEKAEKLKITINKSKVITDETKMIGSPMLSKNKKTSLENHRDIEKPIFRVAKNQERRKAELEELKTYKNSKTNEEYRVKKNVRESIKYLGSSGNEEGFTIIPKSLFLKDTFKGVKITDKMRMDFDNFKKVRINGANIRGVKRDVYIYKTKEGGFKTDYIDKVKKTKFLPKALEKGL